MIKVRDALPADLAACASMAVDSEIGRRYGFEAANLQAKMAAAQAAGAILVVAEVEAEDVAVVAADSARLVEAPMSDVPITIPAGFAWVDPRGAFGSAPYLKLVAVDSAVRSSGIGAALLEEFEKRTAGNGRMWTLLVSDFNARARAFYESHGYREAGRLSDFAIQGVAEIIMVKVRT